MVEVSEAAGLTKLLLRDSDSFSNDEHTHDEKKHDENCHHHGEFDPHVWLGPENLKAIVTVIRDTLARTGAKRAAIYKTNASATIKHWNNLTTEIRKYLPHAMTINS